MDEILFANIDVSAAVLHTMLQRLASNISIQEALRHEIRSQALDSEDGGVIDYIAGQSSLLHRVVMESMRFSPAFGTSKSPFFFDSYHPVYDDFESLTFPHNGHSLLLTRMYCCPESDRRLPRASPHVGHH